MYIGLGTKIAARLESSQGNAPTAYCMYCTNVCIHDLYVCMYVGYTHYIGQDLDSSQVKSDVQASEFVFICGYGRLHTYIHTIAYVIHTIAYNYIHYTYMHIFKLHT